MADSPILTDADLVRLQASDHPSVRALAAHLLAARRAVRNIELAVDGLNMKGFTPRPAEKSALEHIKKLCREQLGGTR